MQSNTSHPFRERQPLLNAPRVVIAAVIVNIAVFVWMRYFLDWDALQSFYYRFAFVPKIFGAQYSLKVFLTTMTYSFIHTSWSHVLLNMLLLIAFGSSLARRMGVEGFIVFWILTAVGGALFYDVMNLNSSIPLVGSSSVYCGFLGAIARFGYGRALFDKIAYEKPLPITVAIRSPIILCVMGLWVFNNLLDGFQSSFSNDIFAWQAHLGGLFAGFFTIGLFVSK